MRVLIKNGTVLTDVDEYKADVLIEDEKIAAIGFNLDETADQIIDATGKYVMPGGVDQHTHFQHYAMLEIKTLQVMKLRILL